MTGVEVTLNRRAHDPPRFAIECSRAGPVLQVRKQGLLLLVERQHRRRDRDVLGSAGAAAGLRVKQRRLAGQRGCAGAPLLVDVRPQLLVVLDRHTLPKLSRVANVGEAVLAAEAGLAIAGEKRCEHLLLRAVRRNRSLPDRTPIEGLI